MTPNRRNLLAAAGASAVLAAPAVRAQSSLPAIRWRMATSYPKSLDVLHGTCELISRRVNELTGGQFEISVHAGGELLPPLGVFDAVSSNSVQCAHTTGYYYIGKNTSLVFDTVLPFGMNARNHLAWMRYGGGLQLLREVYKGYNIVNFPAGNTGAQMGGWFRKPITAVKDLKGLRMRIPGWGGRIFSELGVVTQNIPAGEVYAALEKGTIDASEWVGPHDDEKLGLFKVAQHYHYPGWWEPSAQLSLYVNAGEWEKLPKPYQSAIETASAEAYGDCLANYDAKNPTALRRLVGSGAKLQRFPDAVLELAQKQSEALLDAEAATSPSFAGLLKSYRDFRDLQTAWYGISELSMETATRRRRS